MAVVDSGDDLTFLLELGEALVRSGSSVTGVQRQLLDVANGLGRDDVDIVVFPTILLVQSTAGASARVQFGGFRRRPVRLDQIADVEDLAKDVVQGGVDAAEGIVRLRGGSRRRARQSRRRSLAQRTN